MTKVLTGKIIQTGKMAKTITVKIESRRPDPLYKKFIKKSQKILVDCEIPEVKIGQVVKIGETRPIAKRKSFKVLEILK